MPLGKVTWNLSSKTMTSKRRYRCLFAKNIDAKKTLKILLKERYSEFDFENNFENVRKFKKGKDVMTESCYIQPP